MISRFCIPSGKYAFVTQGSLGIGATMVGDDADAYKEAGNFEVGMIRMHSKMDRIQSLQAPHPGGRIQRW